MKISVIIPCYRSGSFILEAVDSVLLQKGDHNLLEVIVVDDHNDDAETIEALNRLDKNYPKHVKVIKNEGDRGAGAARNVGVDCSNGDWVAFLDADDLFTEYSLESRCKAVQLNPQCRWVGADFSLWNDGEELKEISYFRNRETSYNLLKNAYEAGLPVFIEKPIKYFLQTALTNTVSSLVKKDLFCEVGGFDNNFRLQQDLHLFLRIAAVSSFVFVPEICSFVRQHSNNSTKSEIKSIHWRTKVFVSLLKDKSLCDYKSMLRKKISICYLDLCYSYRVKRIYSKSIIMALFAIRYLPLKLNNWKGLVASIFNV